MSDVTETWLLFLWFTFPEKWEMLKDFSFLNLMHSLLCLCSVFIDHPIAGDSWLTWSVFVTDFTVPKHVCNCFSSVSRELNSQERPLVFLFIKLVNFPWDPLQMRTLMVKLMVLCVPKYLLSNCFPPLSFEKCIYFKYIRLVMW